MQKPMTVSIEAFYSEVARRAITKAKGTVLDFYRRITGRWFCGYCQRYHGIRTVSYDYSDGMLDNVCSLGVSAAGHSTSEAHDSYGLTSKIIALTVPDVEKMNRSIQARECR